MFIGKAIILFNTAAELSKALSATSGSHGDQSQLSELTQTQAGARCVGTPRHQELGINPCAGTGAALAIQDTS